MTETINFYGRRMPYFEFSNFYRAPIKLRGRTWKTSEHYFQAMKFEGYPEHIDAVHGAATPMQAAHIGRDKSRPIVPYWDEIRDVVMYEALEAKFTQHEKLKKILLATGDATLIEHTQNDSYWGDGGDGSGQNKLGRLLVILRDELNEKT